jgi:hypothetical protein
MRAKLDPALEERRERRGTYATSTGDLYGAFNISGPRGRMLRILSSGTDTDNGWEHVSVSTRDHTPGWSDMCFVKSLFWGDDECVVQFHPPKAVYVDCHPHCLHLWKKVGENFQTPPIDAV